MKIETIVNAMEKARGYLIIRNPSVPKNIRGKRQYLAFRARILRMDAAIDEAYVQIAQLMELARLVDRLRKHRMNSDYLIVLDLAPKILKEWDK